jgi:hypothetical protein
MSLRGDCRASLAMTRWVISIQSFLDSFLESPKPLAKKITKTIHFLDDQKHWFIDRI